MLLGGEKKNEGIKEIEMTRLTKDVIAKTYVEKTFDEFLKFLSDHGAVKFTNWWSFEDLFRVEMVFDLKTWEVKDIRVNEHPCGARPYTFGKTIEFEDGTMFEI